MNRAALVVAGALALGCLIAPYLAESLGRQIDRHLDGYDRQAAAILSQNPELRKSLLGHHGPQLPGVHLTHSRRGVAFSEVSHGR